MDLNELSGFTRRESLFKQCRRAEEFASFDIYPAVEYVPNPVENAPVEPGQINDTGPTQENFNLEIQEAVLHDAEQAPAQALKPEEELAASLNEAGAQDAKPSEAQNLAPMIVEIPPDPIPRNMAEADPPTRPQAAENSNTRRRGRPPKNQIADPKPTGVLGERRPYRKTSANEFVLPPGWRTEKRVRQNGRTAGHIDTYYINESTQEVYRSRREVLECLNRERKEALKAATILVEMSSLSQEVCGGDEINVIYSSYL